jgi:ubiquinone/menaquinone biosynthesis C-methylase UbiE
MRNVPYERATEYYDATHAYAPGVAERMADAVLRLFPAKSEARVLEIGAGTGRLGIALANAASQYVGVDIATSLLSRFAEKMRLQGGVSRAALCRADGARLPFRSGAFATVCILHVLHSTSEWGAILAEARRMVGQRGLVVLGYEDSADARHSQSPKERVRSLWRSIITELDAQRYSNRPGVFVTENAVMEWVERSGAPIERRTLAEIEYPALSLADVVDRTASRVYFGDWSIPEGVFRAAVEQLRQRVRALRGDPSEVVVARAAFRALIATWPVSGSI